MESRNNTIENIFVPNPLAALQVKVGSFEGAEAFESGNVAGQMSAV